MKTFGVKYVWFKDDPFWLPHNNNKIFNIDGFAQIEHQQIYDKVLLNLYTNITYKQAIKIIKHTIPKPNNKDEYYELCKQEIRLNKEPEKIFSNFNWLEYLSISRIYYDLDTCKLVIQKLISYALIS